MLPTFIRLENSFEKAVTVKGSPRDKFFSFEGVCLMSNPPFERGYIQRTYANDGIEIETVDLKFTDVCGNELDEGDAVFTVLRSFNDPNTGLPQIEWELQPSGVDFGRKLVMLKIQTGANVFVYSTPFILSDEGSEYTSFWAYRNKGQMLHIGLEMFRRNPISAQVIDNYTSTSGDIVSGVSSLTKQEHWQTNVVNFYVAEEFKVFTQCREVYSLPMFDDGLPLRTFFIDDIESIEPQGDENFGETSFIVNRNESATYNPDSLPPVPPTPPLFPPKINLLQLYPEGNGVVFSFNIENFNTEYLTFEYSLDQISWQPQTKGGQFEEGQEYTAKIFLFNGNTFDFYYRITHPLATSNVLQLPQPKIIIDDVFKTGTNLYQVFYSFENYVPINPLKFMSSLDNINFEKAIYVDGNQNPKNIRVSYLTLAEPYFRIDSQDRLLSSNVFKYEE